MEYAVEKVFKTNTKYQHEISNTISGRLRVNLTFVFLWLIWFCLFHDIPSKCHDVVYNGCWFLSGKGNNIVNQFLEVYILCSVLELYYINSTRVLSNSMLENIFVVIYPKNSFTPELYLASRGLAVAPRSPHATALSRGSARTGADDHLGERGPSLRANNLYIYIRSIYIYFEPYPWALSLLSRR